MKHNDSGFGKLSSRRIAQVLSELLDYNQVREEMLRFTTQRFSEKYAVSLAELESRIEWRNAIELLDRQQKLRRILEWLLHSIPRHFHRPNGTIGESSLTGTPDKDLEIVLQEIERFLTAVGVE